MASYNLEKEPTRPECQLYIINPNSGHIFEVNAIADTGCDMTMIPDMITKQLGNLIESIVRYKGVNGVITETRTYLVNIRVDGYDFNRVEVVGIRKEYALIGRDILNRNKASFDANRNCWRLDCSGNCT
ncbi:MAG: retroviral-like aspartic protease family protein [Prochloraceae cyanobacterium]|nr:retroviral-like aspartic protease family protein [Prochloraceae cyanobacterium]